MSKGNGHPFDCSCNWCNQILYGASGGMRVSIQDISSGSINLGRLVSHQHDYESFKRAYVNPNAQCQLCGQRVFFCQLENGGKVFFDELGPPWIKHPCCDLQKKITNFVITPSSSNYSKYPIFEWEQSGWNPFKLTNVETLNCDIDKIEGIYKGIKLKLFSKRNADTFSLIVDLQTQFELRERQHLPIVQIKRLGKYLFKVSTFIFDEDLNVIPKEYDVFTQLNVVNKSTFTSNKIPPVPKTTKECLTQNETFEKTAFALAFEKAKLKKQ